MNKQTSKILGTALAITLAGGALYGGIKLIQNWDTVKTNTKNFITDVTSKKKIEDLEKQVADLKLKLETANKNVAELEASAEATAEELAQARADAEALQSQLATKENELATAQVRITELENQLSQQNTYNVVTSEFQRFTLIGQANGIPFHFAEDGTAKLTMNASMLKTLGEVVNAQFETVRTYDINDAEGNSLLSTENVIEQYVLSSDATPIVNYVDKDGNSIDVSTLEDIDIMVELLANEDIEMSDGLIHTLDLNLIISPIE